MRTQTIRRIPPIIALAALLAAILASPASAAPERDRYIVVLNDSVDHPGAIARAQTEQRGGELGFVYRHALKGYSAELPKQAVDGLRQDPRVKHVTRDGPVGIFEEEIELDTEDNESVEVLEATIPTGIDRTFATANEALAINGEDDRRADVDVAVIDTGIDQNHPDLDVAGRTDCTQGGESCVDDSGTDGHSHGTHVAGTIGAIDNGEGVVGIAPGARMWAVKVLGDGGGGTFSQVIAGVDWVTATRQDEDPENDIAVANMSLGCPFRCEVPALDEAIEGSVKAGVVHAVAAGNSNDDAKFYSPASSPDVITVSALADYDGKPGGEASPTCANHGSDDHKASFSNWGETIEVAAPGVCTLSTEPGNKYGTKSGTSMASPHVAGAAALLAIHSNPESMEDVEAIGAAIFGESDCANPEAIGAGNCDWTDTSGDGIKEPLLDVGDEGAFKLAEPPTATTEAVTGVTGESATLNATVNPNGTSTTYQFEYGTTTEYGTKVPALPKGIGSGTEPVAVSEPIEGLELGTVYHFRVVASNEHDTTLGEDEAFTTCKGTECEWTLQSTANPEPETKAFLEDVSCASSTMCMAVGNDHYRDKGFSEVWDGSKWTMSRTFNGEMKAISCPTATWCMAIAKNENGAWRLQWEESFGIWTTGAKAPPTPEGATGVLLSDVSCSSETACTVVGNYRTEASEYKPYVARWNGSAWSLQSAPSPSEGSASEAMLSVSCASATMCMAVGRAAGEPFAERWDGSEWTISSIPNPEGATDAILEGVSCTSASACMAVGNLREGSGTRNKTLTERWDGSEWSVLASPNPSEVEGDAKLRGVSCAAADSCIAAGVFAHPQSFPSEEDTTLVESWDGEEWSIQASPNPEGQKHSSLASVSCTSPVACTAVGASRPEIVAVDMVTLGVRYE